MKDPISSMMQRQVWSVDIDDSIATVERLMTDKALSWVPVQETSGAVVGVIGAGDLLQFHAQQRSPDEVSAWQLCSYKPLTVEPDEPVVDVARLMVQRNAHHVVVAQRGVIQGVVSSLDFVRRFVAEEQEATP